MSAAAPAAVCRLLFCTDLVACLTTFVAGVAAYSRLLAQIAAARHDWSFFVPLGYGYTAVVLMVLTNIIGVLFMLFVMAQRHNRYQKHRLQLCLLCRALRLTLMLTVVMIPSIVGHIGLGVAVRTLQLESPTKALAVILLHPVVFWLQPAVFVLPDTLTLLAQLATTAAALQWSRMLPCVLQHAAAEVGTSAALVLSAAQEYCIQAQSWAALLLSAVASPDVVTGWLGPDACSGLTAVQTLQAFCTVCCLLLLPVAAVFWLDRWLLAVQQGAMAGPENTSQTDSSQGVNDAHGTSEADLLRQEILSFLSDSSTRGRNSVLGQGAAVLSFRQAVPANVAIYVMVTASPVVLLVVWTVSELLAGLFAANTDCSAVLQGAGLS